MNQEILNNEQIIHNESIVTELEILAEILKDLEMVIKEWIMLTRLTLCKP